MGARAACLLSGLLVVLLFLNGCATAAPAALPAFAFELPRGSSFGNTTIAVSRKVEAEHDAQVLGRTAGTFGALTCAGTRCSETELEHGAMTGSIRSLGSVE